MTTPPTPAAPAAGPLIIIRGDSTFAQTARFRLPSISGGHGPYVSVPRSDELVARYRPTEPLPDLTLTAHRDGVLAGTVEWRTAGDYDLDGVRWHDRVPEDAAPPDVDANIRRHLVGELERDLERAGYTVRLSGDLDLNADARALLGVLPPAQAAAARELMVRLSASMGDPVLLRQQLVYMLRRCDLSQTSAQVLVDAVAPIEEQDIVVYTLDELKALEHTPPEEIAYCAYGGLMVALSCKPKGGKSTLYYAIAAQAAREGKKVLWISYEETAQQLLAARARALKQPPAGDNFLAIGKETRPSPDQVAQLVRRHEPDLVVIDTLNSYTAARGIELEHAATAEWTREIQGLQDRIIRTDGTAGVILVHPPKNGNSAIIGSVGIEAQLDGVAVLSTPSKDPGETRRQIALHGRGITPAVYLFEVELDGANAASVRRVTPVESAAMTSLLIRTSIRARLLEGPATATELRDAVDAKHADIRRERDQLVIEGKIAKTEHGSSKLYELADWPLDAGEGLEDLSGEGEL